MSQNGTVTEEVEVNGERYSVNVVPANASAARKPASVGQVTQGVSAANLPQWIDG